MRDEATPQRVMSKFTALDDDLHAYLVERGARQDDVLRRLAEETARLGGISIMQVAPDQGALITLLVRAIRAGRAIEVGTFTGYSAICIARGLREDGKLITCDVNEEWGKLASRYFDEAGVAERIEMRVGPAVETLRSIPDDGAFDFAFIDADKQGYPDYYEECLRLLRPGGLLMIDNVLLSGRVRDPATDDESAQAISKLNDVIADDERVDVAMLGISDGVTLALKRED
jgi:caffeoyl-CoA O-methyltransferase